MFERRLKIILALLSVMIGVLLLRSAQVQVVRRNYWRQQASESMKRSHLVETIRGEILDLRGRVLATDKPCIDACVDYRAIEQPPDEQWVKELALERLRNRLGDGWPRVPRKTKEQMRADEARHVNEDIQVMWAKLARVSGRSFEDIEEARQAIVHRVEMRRRYIWYKNYERASEKQGLRETVPGWKKWLVDGGQDVSQVDKFAVTVAEQMEPHVILHAVDNETQNELGKDIDRYPGLVLRPGTHRFYPYNDVACHLLGTLARVSRDDLRDDPNAGNELRQYLPNDTIGRTGIESLCEQALRGTRGRIDRTIGDDQIVSTLQPAAGRPVAIAIDIDLQQQIQSAFANARLRDADGKVEETAVLHGAAVVVDVPTGQVRALVSYPTFDLNTLDDDYSRLRNDDLNDPLRNRATQSQFEPGSTVKPMVGLAGVIEGVVRVDEGIECTGYLILDGKKLSMGRCWVASKFAKQLGGQVAHHPVPWDAPHPTGFLTFSDGLERSCNVYFETVADRLGIDRLSAWYDRFGLGRPTGLGIAEARGRLPASFPGGAWGRRSTGWFAGIGQGWISATPIQMANVAATIARGGIWKRPRLVVDPEQESPATRPVQTPDEVDLHLPAAALAAARDGMMRVVNGAAGTGKALVTGDAMLMGADLAGKTGTAQAAHFHIKRRDAAGHVLKDEEGHDRLEFLEPSTPEHPNPRAPWYRGGGEDGRDVSHAWYIGFAPASHPQIAFCVQVEYGGSGGHIAGSVAREAVEACIEHKYLSLETTH